MTTYKVEVLDEIAQHLPGWHTYRGDEDGYGAELVHEGGARVFVSETHYGKDAGKLHVTMNAPSFFTSNDRDAVDASYKERDVYCNVDKYKYPKVVDRFHIAINVNPARGAAYLARDINKRLLVHAIDYHAEAMAAVEAHRARLDHQAATVARIVDAGARKWGKSGVTFGDYNSAEVTTDGSVRFERLHVTAEQAIAIMRIMRLITEVPAK